MIERSRGVPKINGLNYPGPDDHFYESGGGRKVADRTPRKPPTGDELRAGILILVIVLSLPLILMFVVGQGYTIKEGPDKGEYVPGLLYDQRKVDADVPTGGDNTGNQKPSNWRGE